jgi:hypothetical protein
MDVVNDKLIKSSSKRYFPTGGIVCCENAEIAHEINGLLILHSFKMESAFDVDDLVLDTLMNAEKKIEKTELQPA